MESLAILVATLLALMLATGIAAILLTYKSTNALSNVTLRPLQRLLTIFLATISFGIGIQFVTQVDSLGGRLIGGFGIATALIAFYRVFKK